MSWKDPLAARSPGADSRRVMRPIPISSRKAAGPPDDVSSRLPLDPYPSGWYAVAFSREIAAGEVKRRQFVGREVVAFHTESGVAAVFEAHCPYLGAHFGHGGCVIYVIDTVAEPGGLATRTVFTTTPVAPGRLDFRISAWVTRDDATLAPMLRWMPRPLHDWLMGRLLMLAMLNDGQGGPDRSRMCVHRLGPRSRGESDCSAPWPALANDAPRCGQCESVATTRPCAVR